MTEPAKDRIRKEAEHDRGAVTVFAAVVCLALLAVLWLGVQVGSAVTSRHRAEGAADLASLAAAASVPQGAEFACGRADWVAHRMRARILSCRVEGSEARVRVRVAPPLVPSGFVPAHARARAGPAESAN